MNALFNFNTIDAGRPSFFEMYIQSQMMPSLKPATKYILAILAQKFPKIAISHKYSDEIFYGILFVLERHFLKHYDGSFSENFYGLKRAPVVSDDEAPSPFLKRHRQLSLLFLVLVPYLKDKLDQWYNNNFAHNASIMQAGDIERFSRARRNGKIALLIRVLYPALHATYEALFFAYNLLYMYDYTPFFTPFLHLMNLTVKRLSLKDMQLQSQRAYLRQVRTPQTGIWAILYKVFDFGNLMIDYSKYILPLAIFFFKFLEWWYSDNRASVLESEEIIPPPPEPPKPSPNGVGLPENRSLCPICKKDRVNPALSASGFVFCYPCIYNYVQEHEKCPVTLIPNSLDQIRKVYDEGD